MRVIVGPSGSGKTRLLERIAATPGRYWSALARCRRSDSAAHVFHGALGEALRGGVSDMEDAERLGHLLRRASSTLGRQLPRQALSLGLGRLLGALSAGLAPDVRAAIEKLREELHAETPEGLADRLQEAAGTAVLDSFCALAGEVVAFADGDRLILCIDNGEKLGTDGAELLLDLADDPVAGVRIVVAIRDDIPEGEAVLQRLHAAGGPITPLTLGPLRAEEVSEAAPGLSLPGAQALLERAGDQPINVIGQLTAPLSEVLDHQARIRALLSEVEPEAAEAIRALALYVERPADETLRVLIGGEDIFEFELELLSNGLFESRAGQLPWMHDANRAAVLTELGEDIGRYAVIALRALEEELTHSDQQLLATYELARLAGDQLEGELASALQLGPDALGIFASHLELSAPGQDSLRLSELVRYGSAQWFVRDGATGFKELHQAGLSVASLTEAGVLEIGLTPPGALVVALIRARLHRAHGRAPLPHLAEMLVSYGLPELASAASEVKTTIGPTSIARLAELESNLRSPRERVPTLVLSAEFRGVPLGIAARFDDEKGRNRLAQRLERGTRPVFGKALVLGKALVTPFNVEPARRWSLAANYLGLDLAEDLVEGQGDDRERLSARLQAISRLAERLTPRERAAAELDQPIAIGIYSAEGTYVEVELRGGREGVLDLSQFESLSGEFPIASLIAAEDMLPRLGEYVAQVSLWFQAPPSRHPVSMAIERIESQTAHFNDTQPRLRISTEHRALREMLERAIRERRRDAEILRELYEGNDVDLAEHQNLKLFLSGPRSGEDARALAVWIAALGLDEPQLSIEDASPWSSGMRGWGGAGDLAEFARVIGVEPERIRRVQYTSARNAIAELLGHRLEDIELI